MSVVVKKNALKSFINKFLFEDYPIFGAPTTGRGDTPEAVKDDTDTTIPDEIPIAPTEMMASQLADDRPPIEDENYIPTNSSELGRAVKVMVDLVPDEHIGDFYEEVAQLIDNKISKQTSVSDIEPDLDDEEDLKDNIIPKKEHALEHIKRHIHTLVTETGSSDWSQFELGKHHEDTPDEYYDDYVPPDEVSNRQGETLAALQQITGRATPSGVDKEVRRLLNQMRYAVDAMSEDELNALSIFATGQFINLMSNFAELTPEEIDEMRLNRGMVRDLDSYRFFFNAAMIRPVLKSLQKEAYKKAQELIVSMDVPKEVSSMVMHQALGETAVDLEKIKRKLERAHGPEQGNQMWSSVRNAFTAIQKAVKLPGGFVEKAKEKWNSLSDSKKQSLFQQALESTTDWQKEIQA